MDAQTTALPEVLLHVAVVRPVFLCGVLEIGKSSLVRQFAAALGLDCVSLLVPSSRRKTSWASRES